MLPNINQYKRWSLPSKYSLIGLIIGIVSLIPFLLAFKDWLVAVPDYAALAYNYGSSEMTIYGAEGEMPETAVIIRGANSHEAGIRAEYYWIARRYPGYSKTHQALLKYPEADTKLKKVLIEDSETGFQMEIESCPPLPARAYDVLYIKNWYGRKRKIHFDVTTFIDKGSEPAPEHSHTGNTLQDFIRELDKLKSNKSIHPTAEASND